MSHFSRQDDEKRVPAERRTAPIGARKRARTVDVTRLLCPPKWPLTSIGPARAAATINFRPPIGLVSFYATIMRLVQLWLPRVGSAGEWGIPLRAQSGTSCVATGSRGEVAQVAPRNIVAHGATPRHMLAASITDITWAPRPARGRPSLNLQLEHPLRPSPRSARTFARWLAQIFGPPSPSREACRRRQSRACVLVCFCVRAAPPAGGPSDSCGPTIGWPGL